MKPVLVALAAAVLLTFGPVSHADSPTGNVIIARPPRCGKQTLIIQEYGKSLAQGGWHRVTVPVGLSRYYMGDDVQLTWDADDRIVRVHK